MDHYVWENCRRVDTLPILLYGSESYSVSKLERNYLNGPREVALLKYVENTM